MKHNIEYALKDIGQKCSYKALNRNGEIVGVMLNQIVEKSVYKRSD